MNSAWSEDTVNYTNQPMHGDTVQSIALSLADMGNVVGVDVTAIVWDGRFGDRKSHNRSCPSCPAVIISFWLFFEAFGAHKKSDTGLLCPRNTSKDSATPSL